MDSEQLWNRVIFNIHLTIHEKPLALRGRCLTWLRLLKSIRVKIQASFGILIRVYVVCYFDALETAHFHLRNLWHAMHSFNYSCWHTLNWHPSERLVRRSSTVLSLHFISSRWTVHQAMHIASQPSLHNSTGGRVSLTTSHTHHYQWSCISASPRLTTSMNKANSLILLIQ